MNMMYENIFGIERSEINELIVSKYSSDLECFLCSIMVENAILLLNKYKINSMQELFYNFDKIASDLDKADSYIDEFLSLILSTDKYSGFVKIVKSNIHQNEKFYGPFDIYIKQEDGEYKVFDVFSIEKGTCEPKFCSSKISIMFSKPVSEYFRMLENKPFEEEVAGS